MIDEGFNIHEINRGLRELEATGGAAALELKQVRVKQAHARKALRDAKAHAVFGLINSTPHSARISSDAMAGLLASMARDALFAPGT